MPPSRRSRSRSRRKHEISAHLGVSMLQAPSCHKHNKAAGWHWQQHRALCTGDQLPPSHCPGRGPRQATLSLPLFRSQMDPGTWGRAGETTLFYATPSVDGLRTDKCRGCALVLVQRCFMFGEWSPLGKESRPYPCVTPHVGVTAR